MKRLERRIQTKAFRMIPDAGDKKFRGHAAVFNQAADLGYYTENMMPGCFAKTIARDDIRALWNHDPNCVLGRNVSNTLVLSEDATGLYFEIDPPDTQLARDLRVLIERGDVSQCSIGFYVIGEELSRQNGQWHRDVTESELFDISPVTFPAYTSTDVSLRSSLALSEEELAEHFAALETLRHGPQDPEAWKRAFEHRQRALLLATAD